MPPPLLLLLPPLLLQPKATIGELAHPQAARPDRRRRFHMQADRTHQAPATPASAAQISGAATAATQLYSHSRLRWGARHDLKAGACTS